MQRNKPRANNKRPKVQEDEIHKKPRRNNLDSIAIKPGNGESPSGILSAIKQNVGIESIGSKVSSITESRGGEILIRLMPEDTKRDKLVEALKANLGSRAAIRGLVRYDDIDIQDLDCVTTDTEVEAYIKDALGLPPDDPSVKVKSIRQFHAGIQRATARLKSLDAQSIAKRGRIKIGWVNASVKIKSTATRCWASIGLGLRAHQILMCRCGPLRFVQPVWQ